ncbi:hypothetical protein [Streptomyces sp. NPDC006999]|uniref:hypothetical protein n=1 Tax=Streptomyces sp. NPDC006999 TaxID=3156909 RepID=UPI0033C87D64
MWPLDPDEGEDAGQAGDLAPRLEVFPDERSWSVRMRRASLPLPPADAHLLTRELRPLLGPRSERLADYTRGTEWHDGT